MTAALVVGVGIAVVASSPRFASALVLPALGAWAIASFLQWRNAWRLRFVRTQTRSRPRKEK
jgi:hypothetical protein